MEVWTKMNRISSEKFCIRDNCFNVQQYSNLQNKKIAYLAKKVG